MTDPSSLPPDPSAASPRPLPVADLDPEAALRLLEQGPDGRGPERVLDAGQRAVVTALTTAPEDPGVRGVYLHGGVGRGKTWITDTLTRAAAPREAVLEDGAAAVPPAYAGDAAAAPASEGTAPVRLRLHLHELLGAVNRLSVRHAGSLTAAVRDAVAGVDVLVLDEFTVHDVADGILLTRVLEALLPPGGDAASPGSAAPTQGPRVAITSNTAPEDLLADPMHHHRMAPAVALLRRHLRVLEVPAGEDYRGRAASAPALSADGGFAAGTWWRSESGEAVPRRGGTGPTGEGGVVVEVHGRRVPVTAADEAAGVLTGTFAQLCGAPLSTRDHAALARRFGTWHLTDVPAPVDADPQALQRFAHLVDVLVDRDAALHVSASLDLPWFARTVRESALRNAERLLSRLSLLRRF